MAFAGSSLAQIFAYSQQVPNWAPNERFLPNADYGRVGALKLATNLFDGPITEYAAGRPVNYNHWGRAGAYHYYVLGKNDKKLGNEAKRADLDRAPIYGDYNYGAFNLEQERDGPYHFSHVLTEISEAARTYGFSPQVLVSAVLTHARKKLLGFDIGPVAQAAPPESRTGLIIARYNPSLIEQLWGIRSSGYPTSMSMGLYAARGDYGGKMKRNGGKKRKRRY